MEIQPHVLLVCACLILCAHGATSESSHQRRSRDTERNQEPILITFMLDGLRWDYFEDYFDDGELQGFEEVRKNGVEAEYMTSAFPSLSFVNYYNMMTGLHPEIHGQIHNYMYDPKHDTYFLIGENEDQYESYWWDDGDPLWITAVRQDKKAHMWYWNGCEVEIRGLRPTACKPYQENPNPSIENITSAIDEALELIDNNMTNYIGIYFERIDHYGHREGPGGQNVLENIRAMDVEIKRIQDEITARDLWHRTTLILFSDHGMTEYLDTDTSCINVLDYLDDGDLDEGMGSGSGPIVNLWPAEGKTDEVYNKLKDADVEGLLVYKKEDIPDEYHYKNHYRVSPIVAWTEMGYAIVRPDGENRTCGSLGYHGYVPSHPDMRGIFMARGPDLKTNYKHGSFENLELYQLMCHMLDIEPSEHNGTWSNIEDMLETDDTGGSGSLGIQIFWVLLAAAMLCFVD